MKKLLLSLIFLLTICCLSYGQQPIKKEPVKSTNKSINLEYTEHLDTAKVVFYYVATEFGKTKSSTGFLVKNTWISLTGNVKLNESSSVFDSSWSTIPNGRLLSIIPFDWVSKKEDE